jgi:hypothetical protein
VSFLVAIADGLGLAYNCQLWKMAPKLAATIGDRYYVDPRRECSTLNEGELTVDAYRSTGRFYSGALVKGAYTNHIWGDVTVAFVNRDNGSEANLIGDFGAMNCALDRSSGFYACKSEQGDVPYMIGVTGRQTFHLIKNYVSADPASEALMPKGSVFFFTAK